MSRTHAHLALAALAAALAVGPSIVDAAGHTAHTHELPATPPVYATSDVPGRASSPMVTGEGIVVAVSPAKRQVVLEHGPIEGFMEAMTMGYAVASPALVHSVKPGDRVRFTIDTRARAITAITPVGR